MSLALDTLKFTSVDADLRGGLLDFMIFKALGTSGLPKGLSFIYRYITPASLQQAKPDRFAILSTKGPIGIGTFPPHSWHKEPKESLLKQLGIKVTRGEVPQEAQDMGTHYTVSSQEHSDIVKLYIEGGMGMKRMAPHVNRSTATIHAHIETHNQAVSRSGFCPSCRAVKGPYQETPAKRSKA